MSGSGGGAAREEVLRRVRAALGRPSLLAGNGAPARPGGVPRGYRTAGDDPPGSPRVLDLFVERLADYGTRVHRCAGSEVPDRVAEALGSALRPAPGRYASRTIVVPPGLPEAWWRPLAARPGFRVRADCAPGLEVTELDLVDGVVTACAAAVAETGTLALDASPDQGRRVLTLVPDLHLVVVRAEQVVASVPELLRRLDPQRPLTLVSGPSATSDIELNRVEGVHGPRTLIVVLAE